MNPESLLSEGRKKAFEPPSNPDIKIWRYMDFMRLVNTLEEQGLFFRRTDLFEDRFEGSMSQPLRDFLQQGRDQVSPEDYSQMLRRVRLSSFVNSWHMNESESAAMWRLYSSTTEHAICLQSTYRRLRESLPEDIYIGTVKYISYDRDQIPFDDLWWPLLHKRNSFEYERELRAVWSDIESVRSGRHDDKRIGIFKNVDLHRLIESVYVSAESKPWFVELVKKVLLRYETNVPVRKSDLASEPLFR
jgi:hypothetical protein